MKFKVLNCLSTTAFLFALASCGGADGTSSGGSGSSGLSGVAATGAPMAKASVFIVDSNGNEGASVKTGDDGAYTIVIDSLQAPFLIKVVGTDGKTLMSSASEEDISSNKKVNVTPLTHVITSNVVGNGDANKMFESFATKSSLMTKTNLDSQKTKLKEKLVAAGVFSGLSVSADIDLLNGDLKAGTGAGMDKVLDALKVDVSEEGAVIAPKADPTNSFSDNLVDDSSDTDMSTYTKTPPSKMESANTLMDELKTTMDNMNSSISSFSSDKAAAQAAVKSNMIHPDFLHNGVGGQGDGAWFMICDGLSDTDSESDGQISVSDCTDYEGEDLATSSFKNLNIEKIYDVDNDGDLKEVGDYVDVTYDWYDSGVFDGKETDRFAWDSTDSKWKWIGNGAKYRVSFESLSKKQTTVKFNTSNSELENTYSAGVNMYTNGEFSGIDIEVKGPGIEDGNTAVTMSYNSDINSYVFDSIKYLDDDGKPTDVAQTWPGTTSPRYNYRANFLTFDANKIKEMKNTNEYTITFKKSSDDSTDSTLTLSINKPVILSEDNEDDYILELENASSYCQAPPSAVSGSIPTGVELVNVNMSYWIDKSGGGRQIYVTNGENLSKKGNFNLPVTYSGSETLESGEFVGNLNAFLWLEDVFYRNFSVEFNCFYDSTI